MLQQRQLQAACSTRRRQALRSWQQPTAIRILSRPWCSCPAPRSSGQRHGRTLLRRQIWVGQPDLEPILHCGKVYQAAKCSRQQQQMLVSYCSSRDQQKNSGLVLLLLVSEAMSLIHR